MKYTLVYRDDPRGYCWTVMNNHGLYAAVDRGFDNSGKYSIRRWATSAAADEYMQIHMREDCVWKPWPTEKPARIKPVTTAASYKPAHGGYPEPEGTAKPRCVGQELDRMAAGWASMGTYDPAEHMRQRWAEQRTRMDASQPLVWPVIPQADDGSNEEATTIPDVLVQALAQRVFVIRLRNALKGY